MTSSNAPAVRVRNLVKRYGSLVAVDGLDLEVAHGETFALLGPNGAGKTSTVEILEGLRRADGGEVEVLGLDPVRDHRRLMLSTGVMLQEGGIYPGATPLELLRLFAAFYPDPRPAEELLAEVELSARSRTPYRRLSGGEKQRLSLALALVGRPRLVFLDEPTAGMDPVARRTTWAIVEGLKADGVTCILTTHYMEEAETLADRVAIVHRGRKVAEGPPDELVRARGGITIRTRGSVPIAELAALVGAPVQEIERGMLRIDVAPEPRLVARIAAWFAERGALIEELRVGAAGLEEIFLHLTDDENHPSRAEEPA